MEAHARVVPKGLRSFEAADSGFFLDLLPGPFDRDGLPASIRFWKTRVEKPNPGRVFRAGVIYGPSGCGKSSLVKAGLLPRLARSVTAIYREATPADTEAELARDIRRAPPEARGENLSEMLADIRRRELVAPGGKLLIVLDQFEQWLHASADYARAPLTLTLRQTDGVTIAALLMVRDDFWPSITRFMQELEIRMSARATRLCPFSTSPTILKRFRSSFSGAVIVAYRPMNCLIRSVWSIRLT